MKSSRAWKVLAILCAASVTALGDSILSVQPPSSTVQEGAPFSLDVSIADVTDLYAFEFDLSFDPLNLSAIDVTEGLFVSSGGSTFFLPGTIDNGGGIITFNADSLIGPVPGISGGGILAVVRFAALTSGVSAVSLSNVQLFDPSLNTINFTSSDGVVRVEAVPEPSSFALVFLGATILSIMAVRSCPRSTGSVDLLVIEGCATTPLAPTKTEARRHPLFV